MIGFVPKSVVVVEKRGIPKSSTGCYKISGSRWVGVVMCADTCLYRSKPYKCKRDASSDAARERRRLELDVDAALAVVSNKGVKE